MSRTTWLLVLLVAIGIALAVVMTLGGIMLMAVMFAPPLVPSLVPPPVPPPPLPDLGIGVLLIGFGLFLLFVLPLGLFFLLMVGVGFVLLIVFLCRGQRLPVPHGCGCCGKAVSPLHRPDAA